MYGYVLKIGIFQIRQRNSGYRPIIYQLCTAENEVSVSATHFSPNEWNAPNSFLRYVENGYAYVSEKMALSLVPYGCTALRISCFPRAKL